MPIMNLAVILIILGLGYFWAGQGMFSAFIHFICVIVAGAIAFAVWEPLSYGVLLGVREDIAWTVGLLLPFVVTLAVLRVATNKLIPSNMDFSDAANFVGGGVFGALSGLLTAGVLVIGIAYLRVPPDFLGYRAANWDRATGAVDQRNGQKLWIPADLITARTFELLSAGSLASATPMAERMPDVHVQGALLRTTYEDRSRTTLKPADVSVVGRYTVTAENVRELLSDTFMVSGDGTPIPQSVTLPDGSNPPAGSRIEGFAVQFGPGAKEKKGQTVIGPGQIRLIVDTPTGAMNIGPVAFVSRASGSTLQVNRYRFDGEGVYAASVGGASDATIAFEFIVPPNATPTDLLIKNVRQRVSRMPAPTEYVSIAQRDEQIRSGAVIGVRAQSESAPEIVSGGTGGPTIINTPPPGGLSNQLQDIRETTALGFTFNKQNRGALELNDKNLITNGSVKLDRSRMGSNIDNILAVNQFTVPPGTTMVQVDISPQSRLSLLGRALDSAELLLPPVIVDTLGQRYQAVGYIYEDQTTYEIRFTPGAPIRALSEVPSLSRSRSDQRLKLLFTPSLQVQIASFNLGQKTQAEFNPPLPLIRQR